MEAILTSDYENLTRIRPVRLGKYYVPIQLLKTSSKGDVYGAVSLRNFSFSRCIIKHGNPGALLDQYNRDMKDRLLWQKSVLEDLHESVVTPGYIDYFEAKGRSYLVIEYADGTTLFDVVKNSYQDKTWRTLPLKAKRTLLNLFIASLALVDSVHHKGYVHRDITDSNFMLLKDGRLCILDFELSYAVEKKTLEHPFLLGTFGYVAPEQLKQAKPDYKEDIYSLGALLCFLLSNTPPVKFVSSNLNQVQQKLLKITLSHSLTKVIIDCLSAKRSQRPSISILKTVVSKYLNQLK
ncbi:serine/threonine protein kinase [Pedobacter hartonius]|uniref:non-specific serine/threonine protein kinase n=1 Tax=Pedobacter hartonius TaxID=425514 RepID=A0A1H4G5N4_9SPHI|nr:protein kinase [Pedobacter hartonius]SEB04933.1 Protein kinase domain-containing protein [Pedobacter hartonius]